MKKTSILLALLLLASCGRQRVGDGEYYRDNRGYNNGYGNGYYNQNQGYDNRGYYNNNQGNGYYNDDNYYNNYNRNDRRNNSWWHW